MRRFDLRSRGDLAFQAGLFLVVGGFLFVPNLLWAFGLANVNGKSRPETSEDWFLVAAISVFGLIGLGLGTWFVRSPLAVELDSDGSLRFVRLLGTTSTSIAEILEVDIVTATISEEGADARMLRVRHTRGTMSIPFSASTNQLIAELRRRVPAAFGELPSHTAS